jgi:hypothetical protein
MGLVEETKEIEEDPIIKPILDQERKLEESKEIEED